MVGAALGAALGTGLVDARRGKKSHEPPLTYEQRLENGSVLVIVSGTDDELIDAQTSLQTVGPISMQRIQLEDQPDKDSSTA